MTKPSQFAREAAAALFRTDWARDEALAGQRDDDQRVQAFAEFERATLERAAKVIEQFPDEILQFYDRPSGPPGNQLRPATNTDRAAAIRNLIPGEQ